jgi:hypothetical protein
MKLASNSVMGVAMGRLFVLVLNILNQSGVVIIDQSSDQGTTVLVFEDMHRIPPAIAREVIATAIGELGVSQHMSPALPIQVSKLKFDAKQLAWRHAGSDTDLEFIVAGGETGPAPRALAVAESVLADVSTVVTVAVDYLKRKLDGAESLRDNSWYLEWVEFGVGERLEFDEFELFLSEARDAYTLWSVRFRKKTAEFAPISVTRADW